jgi:hypothetical protein
MEKQRGNANIFHRKVQKNDRVMKTLYQLYARRRGGLRNDFGSQQGVLPSPNHSMQMYCEKNFASSKNFTKSWSKKPLTTVPPENARIRPT